MTPSNPTKRESLLLIESIPNIVVAISAILIGFVGLVWSADRFVAGAAAFALNLGIAPMLVGLTVVSVGTSAPEILVSVNAALAGSSDIAVGNALGSNIANIGLVLAITALIAGIPVQRAILADEMPLLLLVTLLAGYCLWDARLDAGEGWLLFASLGPTLAYMVWSKQRRRTPREIVEEDEELHPMSNGKALFWFSCGLALLVLSSKILVWGAQTTATHYSVSPLIIGLTVLAVGTSLPELAASVVSALRGHHDIALGNIVGSNIFNLLAVMSVAAIIHPAGYEAAVFNRDYVWMAALTFALAMLALLALMLGSKTRTKSIGRLPGLLLLLCYGAYIVILSQAAQ